LNHVTLSEVAVTDSFVVEEDAASPVPESTIASNTLVDATAPVNEASDAPASEGDTDATLPRPESTMAISIVNDVSLSVVAATDSDVVKGDAASPATESAIASSSLNDRQRLWMRQELTPLRLKGMRIQLRQDQQPTTRHLKSCTLQAGTPVRKISLLLGLLFVCG
jgi:hypothetical protein